LARTAITKEVLRALFSKTGNQCAFPDCTHVLIDNDDEFVAQVCHIEAANVGGERYNPQMTDEDRRSVKNLIVLCYQHHIKTNNVKLYPVLCLQNMKAEHEASMSEHVYKISEQAVGKISKEQSHFRDTVSNYNKAWRDDFDLAMELEFFDDANKHIAELYSLISWITNLEIEVSIFLDSLPDSIEAFIKKIELDKNTYSNIPYYENPFCNVLWESRNIGIPNMLKKISFHTKALEVHIGYQNLKEDPKNISKRRKLDALQSELKELASTLSHHD